jgi:periplasmic divalent cation tolerance protein
VEQICVVTTVVDARSVADVLAAAVVAGRLAACAQVGAQVDSTYWWQSRMETSAEWSVQFKTAPDRLAALVDQLRTSHPYDVPEILVTRVESGNPDYAAWVHEHTRPLEGHG